MRLPFKYAGEDYTIVAPFDAGSALSAARRVRVAAEWIDGGAPGDDPTRPEDWWRLSTALSCVERANADGTIERMATGELLHDDLSLRDAAQLFEVAAHHVALAQLQSLPPEQCGGAA